MIDIEKVRLWNVRFIRAAQLQFMPYPCMIVEEVEGPGYCMPQCSPHTIPLEVGGQITITLEGKGVLEVSGEKFDCVPGTAFLYRDSDPTVSYYFPRNGRGKWRFVWINFIGETSSRIIAEINRIYGYHFRIGKEHPLTEKLLSYRKYAGATLSISPLEGAQMVFDLLDQLCRPSQGVLKQDKNSRRIQDVQAELQSAFAESLTTAALAKKLGISREHLSKSFRAETGRTLQDYREEQRLNEALSLLLKSNLSCKEIAILCHYGSYSSFFRSFKKHYHLPPEMFREKPHPEDLL